MGKGNLRIRLLIAQGGICPLCGCTVRSKLHRSERKRQLATIDHVWPRAGGGRNGVGNFLIVHSECNGRKSGREPYPCELVWLMAVNERLGINKGER